MQLTSPLLRRSFNIKLDSLIMISKVSLLNLRAREFSLETKYNRDMLLKTIALSIFE
jgi:hypothetical protein